MQLDVDTIVAAGVRAPSADNRHRFKVRSAGGALELLVDDEFLAAKERHRRVLTLFSYGAVIENMVLAAGRHGCECEVVLRPDSRQPRLLARIGPLRADRAQPDELAAAIEQRHTNRRMYRPPGPDATACDLLASEVDAFGARVHWPKDEARTSLLKMIWLAESERFRRRALHAELFGAVRFDVGWSGSADEALAPATLEVEPAMRPIFKAMRRWPLMRASHFLGGHRLFGLRAGWLPCWQAPALGVVSTAGGSDAQIIGAGRGFERLWLRATLLGLAMQPMAASAVLAMQEDAPGHIDAAARSKLLAGWRSLLGDRLPVLVFRIGRADAPSGRTGRLPAARYIDRQAAS